CSLVDLGTRFRLIIAEVDCLEQKETMPNLPVASALWCPRPDFATGIEAWLVAGGAHHTAFSYDITSDQMCDWAEIMGVEAVVIDAATNIRALKNELRQSSVR
ncbi:MAG: L-arabinose isomerase, partial [Kiritimatiellaeota bacterium]|nr:L-arabinose isomerase [Kiritimatiellota bacterium]